MGEDRNDTMDWDGNVASDWTVLCSLVAAPMYLCFIWSCDKKAKEGNVSKLRQKDQKGKKKNG